MLLRNPRHPSLQAKKLEEKAERYSARVNDAWRFYYYREADIYYLVTKATPRSIRMRRAW
jgi:uncharacterized membrane protein